ncbi:MAG: hypothetical protein ACOCX1_01785 [Fimbriimonadaceae bacterium]
MSRSLSNPPRMPDNSEAGSADYRERMIEYVMFEHDMGRSLGDIHREIRLSGHGKVDKRLMEEAANRLAQRKGVSRSTSFPIWFLIIVGLALLAAGGWLLGSFGL